MLVRIIQTNGTDFRGGKCQGPCSRLVINMGWAANNCLNFVVNPTTFGQQDNNRPYASHFRILCNVLIDPMGRLWKAGAGER